VSNDVKLVLARKDGNSCAFDKEAEAKLNVLIDPNIEELRGLLGRWKEMPATRVYAVICLETNEPIGLVAWTGPNDNVDPSWWIHSNYRGCRFGSRLINALAKEMKRCRVTGLKPGVTIQTPGGQYDNQSRALIKRLQSKFQ